MDSLEFHNLQEGENLGSSPIKLMVWSCCWVWSGKERMYKLIQTCEPLLKASKLCMWELSSSCFSFRPPDVLHYNTHRPFSTWRAEANSAAEIGCILFTSFQATTHMKEYPQNMVKKDKVTIVTAWSKLCATHTKTEIMQTFSATILTFLTVVCRPLWLPVRLYSFHSCHLMLKGSKWAKEANSDII